MRFLGYALFGVAGIVMFAFQVYWFYQWWGDIGGIIGFFVPPAAVVFPFLYLLKQGMSYLYFGVWAVGLLGLLLVGWGEKY